MCQYKISQGSYTIMGSLGLISNVIGSIPCTMMSVLYRVSCEEDQHNFKSYCEISISVLSSFVLGLMLSMPNKHPVACWSMLYDHEKNLKTKKTQQTYVVIAVMLLRTNSMGMPMVIIIRYSLLTTYT